MVYEFDRGCSRLILEDGGGLFCIESLTNEVGCDSEQAEKSEELFKSKYNHVKINKECTYYFEFIYLQTIYLRNSSNKVMMNLYSRIQ